MEQMQEEVHIEIIQPQRKKAEVEVVAVGGKQQKQLEQEEQIPQAHEAEHKQATAAIESTIIHIPSININTATGITEKATSPLPAASSAFSLIKKKSCLFAPTLATAYDTDSSSSSISSSSSSSTASSTCCTRYGEEIYMEHGIVGVVGVNASAADTDADDDMDAVRYKTEHRKSWPIFILMISVIEIAIFVYDFMQMQPKAAVAVPVSIPTDSVLIYRPDRRLEMWRFVSYMFLHANLFHLGFNVVVQLFYGIPLEVMHGSARIAIIYFAGVFAGSLGTSVVDSEVYLVGASGGVYALLAAHLANITLNYSQMKYAVAQLLSVLIFVTCDLGYAFYTQFLFVNNDEQHLQHADKHHRYHHHAHFHQHMRSQQAQNKILTDRNDLLGDFRSAPPVSYIAHLTGALAGLTIGLLVLKNFERRAYKNLIWWLALGIYSAFTVFAIAFNLINTMTAQLMEEQGEVITQHLLHDLGVS